MSKKIVFDLDDFSPGNALEMLLKIKDHFPKFKCTMFTIAAPAALITGDLPLKKYQDWCDLLKEFPWIEVALHGFGHVNEEMNTKTKNQAMTVVKASENMMQRMGVKHAKIWKSPYWQTSQRAYEVLAKRGYLVAVDKNQPEPKVEGMTLYKYNWSIEQPMPDVEVVKAHGHCYGTTNDINICLPNVLREMPTDAEFLTISEYFEQYGSDQGR